MPDVVVIGGGAAGMMAASSAAEEGRDVLIIEKNKMMGRKMLITGKGRCNVTNIAPAQEMLKFVPKNNRFLFSALGAFDSGDLMEMLENEGVELKTERGGRVFPKSDKSADIVNGFRRMLAKKNVRFLQDDVRSLILSEGAVVGVSTAKGRKVLSNKVILCTGGMSYPLTGSDGYGYQIAREAGHTVTELRPALIPLETAEKWAAELQGLSLKNVAVRLLENGKKIYDDFGEMMFTHFGITGPVVLSSSCHINDIAAKKYNVEIDLKPALDPAQLEARVLRDFTENANKNFENALGGLFPQKLIPVMVKLSGIDPYKKVNSVTKQERKHFCELIKKLSLTVSGFRPIEEAIVTDGGVAVKEINPSTMESKIIKGLYFAGEVIDVAAYTGGFNLQIAFSTGYLAGKNAAKKEE